MHRIISIDKRVGKGGHVSYVVTLEDEDGLWYRQVWYED